MKPTPMFLGTISAITGVAAFSVGTDAIAITVILAVCAVFFAICTAYAVYDALHP